MRQPRNSITNSRCAAEFQPDQQSRLGFLRQNKLPRESLDIAASSSSRNHSPAIDILTRNRPWHTTHTEVRTGLPPPPPFPLLVLFPFSILRIAHSKTDNLLVAAPPFGAPPSYSGFPGASGVPGMAPPGLGSFNPQTVHAAAPLATANTFLSRPPTRHVLCSRNGTTSWCTAAQ